MGISDSSKLIPCRAINTDEIRAAIADLKAFQVTHSLGGCFIRDMIEEGRARGPAHPLKPESAPPPPRS